MRHERLAWILYLDSSVFMPTGAKCMIPSILINFFIIRKPPMGKFWRRASMRPGQYHLLWRRAQATVRTVLTRFLFIFIILCLVFKEFGILFGLQAICVQGVFWWAVLQVEQRSTVRAYNTKMDTAIWPPPPPPILEPMI